MMQSKHYEQSRKSFDDGVYLFWGVTRGVAVLVLFALLVYLATKPAQAETLAALPDAPVAASGVSSSSQSTANVSNPFYRPVSPLKVPFLANNVNRALVAGEFTVWTLDAVSTEQFMHNPCRCFHESGSSSYVAAHPPLQYAYSLSVAAGYTLLSAELWKHNHHRLSRLVLMGSIGYDAVVGPIHNWNLTAPKKGMVK